MKKLKRLLTMLLCLVMLMPSAIAAQANESDSLTVKPATTGTITDFVVTKTVYDENGNELEDDVEIELLITFDECYGILEYTTDLYNGGTMPFPIVREGSKMHVEVIRNGEYIETPHLLENRHCFNLCYDFETDDFGYVMWREDLDDNVDKSKDLVKEGENKYCYTMYNGVNHYFMGSERFVFGGPWEQILLATVLAVNDEQIKQMKETGVMTFSINGEHEYTCAWPGVYWWLFGEETPNFDFSNIDIKGYKCIYKSESEIQFLYRLTNNNAEDVLSSFIIIPIKYENKTPVSFSGYASVRVKLPANSEKIGVLSIDTSENSANFKIYDDDSHIEVPETIFTSNSSVNGAIIIQCSDKNEETSIIEELESNYILPMETRKTLSDEEVSIGLQYLKNLIVKGDIQKL